MAFNYLTGKFDDEDERPLSIGERIHIAHRISEGMHVSNSDFSNFYNPPKPKIKIYEPPIIKIEPSPILNQDPFNLNQNKPKKKMPWDL
jgi:hypothetical protein